MPADVKQARKVVQLMVLAAWADGRVAGSEAITIQKLVNELPKQVGTACMSGTSCSPDCGGPNAPTCCGVTGETAPDCFHGLNVTNIHFHMFFPVLIFTGFLLVGWFSNGTPG